MPERPDPVATPFGPDPTQTGEVGSEGGGPGDLLRSPVRPADDRGRDAARPGGVPALLWWAVLVPVGLVLLWFVTSAASR